RRPPLDEHPARRDGAGRTSRRVAPSTRRARGACDRYPGTPRHVLAGAGPAGPSFHADTNPWTVPRRRLDRHRAASYHRERRAKRPSCRGGGPSDMRSIVVHYKELALKGRNRPWFVQVLVRNMRAALGDDVRSVRSIMGRIEIDLAEGTPFDRVRERLQRVFGIANFSYAGRAPHDFDALA